MPFPRKPGYLPFSDVVCLSRNNLVSLWHFLPDDAITITFDSKPDARHFVLDQMVNGTQAVLVYEKETVLLLTVPFFSPFYDTSPWTTNRRAVRKQPLEHETVIAVLNVNEAPPVDSFSAGYRSFLK